MRKSIVIIVLAFLGIVLFWLVDSYRFAQSKNLKAVFCDVGQGDAIFIRTPEGNDILVDGGPDERVLDCLSQNMPFWDRDIELVILSHPHADHLNGLIAVLKAYDVKQFVTEELANKSSGYKKLMVEVGNQKLKVQYVFSGDRLKTNDGVVLNILGPSKSFLSETNAKGIIGESKEFGNVVTEVRYGNFSMLLTGDSQIRGLSEAIEYGNLKDLSVFQVPHHGSRFGLSKEILERLRPELGVISVGKKNKYGHPSPQALTNLQQTGVKYLRTDEKGSIEIETDGRGFKIED